jgi:hypothetical protein
MSNPNPSPNQGQNPTGLHDTGPSADQIHTAAMSQGCTEEGAKLVVEILTENRYLDSDDVIKEVASGKTSDKDEVIAKVTKKAEAENKKEKEKEPATTASKSRF